MLTVPVDANPPLHRDHRPAPRRGPIEMTVHPRECPRCNDAKHSRRGQCVCIDEVLDDLPWEWRAT
jgi:hypothetical protein